jgi:hypothetical protein
LTVISSEEATLASVGYDIFRGMLAIHNLGVGPPPSLIQISLVDLYVNPAWAPMGLPTRRKMRLLEGV